METAIKKEDGYYLYGIKLDTQDGITQYRCDEIMRLEANIESAEKREKWILAETLNNDRCNHLEQLKEAQLPDTRIRLNREAFRYFTEELAREQQRGTH